MRRLPRLLESLRRMFGVAAPRVAVRAHLPWALRGGMLALLIGLGAGLGWWIYEAGRQYSGNVRTEAVAERPAGGDGRLQKENEQLVARVAAVETQLQMEHAAHEDLVRQLNGLTEENARLKEDLAFFQNLVPASGKEGGLQVYRFRVERDRLPGEYRYGLLLVQAGQRVKEFQGSLQLLVNIQHDGMRQVVTLPEDLDEFPRGQRVSFRYYQRVEGRFRVAPDAVVESLQVRVYPLGASEAAVTHTAKVS